MRPTVGWFFATPEPLAETENELVATGPIATA